MKIDCPCPVGCIVGEQIDPSEPEDAVRVVCTNPKCTNGRQSVWVHMICFKGWEQQLLSALKQKGKPVKDGQFLWTNKKCLDLVEFERHCGGCKSGQMQKDIHYTPPPSPPSPPDTIDEDGGFIKVSESTRKQRRRTNSKQLPVLGRGGGGNQNNLSNGGGGNSQTSAYQQLGPRLRNRAASLGSAGISIMSSSSSSSSSNNHQQNCSMMINNNNNNNNNNNKTSITPHHSHHYHHNGNNNKREHRRSEGPGSEYFTDKQVGITGSIFARRQNLNSLYKALPRWKVNGFHIKLEDDCPQGNDDTRIFLLTTLGDHKMREVKCLLCSGLSRVYDRYPLVDGTFFLSPVNHKNEGIPVRHDTRDCYLHSMCVNCLETVSERLCCLRCGSRGWFPGAALVLGSLYLYDVLSSAPCCSPECNDCKAQMPLPDASLQQYKHYSAFSEPSNCQNCGHRDAHYVRRMNTIRMLPMSAMSTVTTAERRRHNEEEEQVGAMAERNNENQQQQQQQQQQTTVKYLHSSTATEFGMAYNPGSSSRGGGGGGGGPTTKSNNNNGSSSTTSYGSNNVVQMVAA